MMTHKARILAAARGEMADVLPYVPRIDLWYNANSYVGTLPKKHRGRTQDEISRAEGWAMHKVIPELLKVSSPEENLHRGLGLYSLKENGYRIELSSNIEVTVKREGDLKRVEYHTPLGTIGVAELISEEMRRAGASITWLEERAIKKVEDYRVLAYVFENITVHPDYEKYAAWQTEIGDDGVACMMGTFAASPIHHIQRDLLEATDFYFEFNDHEKEMRRLADGIGHVYDQILKIVSDSPAEVVLWGANYDDMITYAPFFAKELMPWLQKASACLEAKGKLLISHCDGENLGLMDLIRDSGINIAEAICPFPMTKVRIGEYYEKFSNKLTIFGGVPSNILLAESATEEEFDAYLDNLFQSVAPGKRLILGIADTTPPNAVFERLIKIGERVRKEARLPLEGGAARPLGKEMLAQAAARVVQESAVDADFEIIRQDVLKGDNVRIKVHVQEMLDRGVSAENILQKGMLSAMEKIGERFKKGDVFIPEVLLSARAMNECLPLLEPHLTKGMSSSSGKIIIGTVRGDMHDIGKNMVATMLKGVGFDVVDIGVNVPRDEFVRRVAKERPDILGISALLTTTMPEMKAIILAVEAAGLREDLKVIVGGAPVNEKFANDIGADGYGQDAGAAVAVVKELLGG